MSAPNEGEPARERELGRVNLPLLPGDLIGEYRIDAKIGEGGFGCVYRVTHPVIGKTAAVKVLSLQCSLDPDMVNRFIDEARAVNQINHRNIIDIFSFGNLPDGRWYYVMEYLNGQPLDQYLAERGRLTPEQTIEVLAGVARALDAAHAQGIAHRDLKPENVFVVFGEEGSRVKLLDFGVAKLLGQARQYKTQSGVPIGTSYYMSPEQCRGAPVDQRTDIYSLGVLTFELLTGTVPFDADSHVAVLIKHVSEAAPRLSDYSPDLPAALDAPVQRMLAKDPMARPASATEALLELARAAHQAGFKVTPNLLDAQLTARTPRQLRTDITALEPAQDSPFRPSPPGGDRTPAAATVAPRNTARSMWLLVTAALGASAVGAVILIQRFVINAPFVAVATTTEPALAPHPSSTTATRSASATPPSVSPIPSPAPSTVELRVDAIPANTEVYANGRRLGFAPGPFPLPHQGTAVSLVFRAVGYRSRIIEFKPTEPGIVSVVLEKEVTNVRPAPRPSAQPANGDLEF